MLSSNRRKYNNNNLNLIHWSGIYRTDGNQSLKKYLNALIRAVKKSDDTKLLFNGLTWEISLEYNPKNNNYPWTLIDTFGEDQFSDASILNQLIKRIEIAARGGFVFAFETIVAIPNKEDASQHILTQKANHIHSSILNDETYKKVRATTLNKQLRAHNGITISDLEHKYKDKSWLDKVAAELAVVIPTKPKKSKDKELQWRWSGIYRTDDNSLSKYLTALVQTAVEQNKNITFAFDGLHWRLQLAYNPQNEGRPWTIIDSTGLTSDSRKNSIVEQFIKRIEIESRGGFIFAFETFVNAQDENSANEFHQALMQNKDYKKTQLRTLDKKLCASNGKMISDLNAANQNKTFQDCQRQWNITTDLHTYFQNSDKNKVVGLILNNPEELIKKDSHGFTPLHYVETADFLNAVIKKLRKSENHLPALAIIAQAIAINGINTSIHVSGLNIYQESYHAGNVDLLQVLAENNMLCNDDTNNRWSLAAIALRYGQIDFFLKLAEISDKNSQFFNPALNDVTLYDLAEKIHDKEKRNRVTQCLDKNLLELLKTENMTSDDTHKLSNRKEAFFELIKNDRALLAQALDKQTKLNEFFSVQRGIRATNTERSTLKKIHLQHLLLTLTDDKNNIPHNELPAFLRKNTKYRKDIFNLIKNNQELLERALFSVSSVLFKFFDFEPQSFFKTDSATFKKELEKALSKFGDEHKSILSLKK